ncbi:CLUMA_CG005112, isoform A [Clunio marinus]|uniref:CLUMA_CG005112, isoform A n=1 Tax=Clunio marinus TaxID=568069 RepID=A0A1J1HZ90_9DIPT|nr:CLUMA_CG005112, isoform A [Clunio marinus]
MKRCCIKKASRRLSSGILESQTSAFKAVQMENENLVTLTMSLKHKSTLKGLNVNPLKINDVANDAPLTFHYNLL